MTNDAHADYGWREAAPECSVPYTLPAMLPVFARYSIRSILDLGCGNGGLTASLAESGFDIVGCDRDASGIALAKETHPGVEFQQIGFEEVPDNIQGPFDAVISTEVIEHLYDPAALLRCAKRMLAPNGLLLITTPHYGFAKQLAVVFGGLWEEHHQVSRVGGHIKLFSPKGMRQLLQEQGFVTRRIGGAGRCWPVWKTMVVEAVAKNGGPDA